MTREEAYKFIKALRKLAEDGVEIAEVSADGVVLRFADATENWYTDWYAAKAIEANSS